MATGLTAFEKYTDSWRLDHPNFKDVKGTDYAVGTITAIQQDDTDPDVLKVISKVKVQIEGQAESDYLPLFFCPKEGYWDTADHQAKDFNEDDKYYENAWMSFRVGDEVKVLLQAQDGGDLIPFAVLGFADDVPRIGEYVAKMVFNDTAVYIKLFVGEENENEDKGPDEKDLKLVQECQIYDLGETGDEVIKNECQFWNNLTREYTKQSNFEYECPHPYEDTPTGWDEEKWYEYYDIWSWTKTTQNYHSYAILLPIGPILYRYTFMIYRVKIELKMLAKYTLRHSAGHWEASGLCMAPTYTYTGSTFDPYSPEWYLKTHIPGLDPYIVQGETPPDGAEAIPWIDIPNPPSMFVGNGCPYKASRYYYVLGYHDSEGNWYYPGYRHYAAGVWIDNPNEEAPPGVTLIYFGAPPVGFTITEPNLDPYYYSITGGAMSPEPLSALTAALYKKEIADDPTADDFKYDKSAPQFDDLLTAFNPPSYEDGTTLWDNPSGFLQAFVRPHSKEELQDAGLWPN